MGLIPWIRKIPWRRKWQPSPVFLPGKFHGQRSLVGYSPWGCKESDMTKWLSTRLNEVIRVGPSSNKAGVLRRKERNTREFPFSPDAYREKAKGGQRKRLATISQQERTQTKPTSMAPRSWTSSFQDCEKKLLGTFLVVKWLGLWASTAEGTGSIPGQGPKIPHAHGTAKNKFLLGKSPNLWYFVMPS